MLLLSTTREKQFKSNTSTTNTGEDEKLFYLDNL